MNSTGRTFCIMMSVVWRVLHRLGLGNMDTDGRMMGRLLLVLSVCWRRVLLRIFFVRAVREFGGVCMTYDFLLVNYDSKSSGQDYMWLC